MIAHRASQPPALSFSHPCNATGNTAAIRVCCVTISPIPVPILTLCDPCGLRAARVPGPRRLLQRATAETRGGTCGRKNHVHRAGRHLHVRRHSGTLYPPSVCPSPYPNLTSLHSSSHANRAETEPPKREAGEWVFCQSGCPYLEYGYGTATPSQATVITARVSPPRARRGVSLTTHRMAWELADVGLRAWVRRLCHRTGVCSCGGPTTRASWGLGFGRRTSMPRHSSCRCRGSSPPWSPAQRMGWRWCVAPRSACRGLRLASVTTCDVDVDIIGSDRLDCAGSAYIVHAAFALGL